MELKEHQSAFKIVSTPNISPILEIKETQKDLKDMSKGGLLLIRQYYSYNLKERLASMPYLKLIEKKWLAFQMIYSVLQLHNLNYTHNDIKIENFMLTSNMSVILVDSAPYKPAYIPQDELGLLSYFFGEIVSDHSISLAPERLINKKEFFSIMNQSNEKTIYSFTNKMDIFSLGCVLCELFTEDALFDLPKLLEYKDGKKSIDCIVSYSNFYKSCYFNENIINDRTIYLNNSNNKEDIDNSISKLYGLIIKMLSINPEERPNIRTVFKEFTNKIAPISFGSMFLQINTLMISSDIWFPDNRIGLFYKHWNQIWKIILGPRLFNLKESNICKNNLNDVNNIIQLLNIQESLNLSIVNKLLLDKPFENKFYLDSMFLNNNLSKIKDEDLYLDEQNQNIFKDKNNVDSIFIFINWILPTLKYSKYSSTKLIAIEMLLKFSKFIPDIDKIQILIPYFTKTFQDNNSLIKIKSLNAILIILLDIPWDFIVPSSDINFYDDYTWPAIEELAYNSINQNDVSVSLFITNNIDIICNLHQKFLQITLNSKFIIAKESNRYKDSNALVNTNTSILNYNPLKQTIVNNVSTSILGYNNTNNTLNNEKILNNKNANLKKNFIHEFDNSSSEFKLKLCKLIEDTLSESLLEIQIALTRKFPSLILFIGRKEINNFSKFIIALFNKKQWVIQSEILDIIPGMVLVLGSDRLNDILLPCMESIIYDNTNEHKLLSLTKCIKNLYNMEFIKNNKIIDIIKKIFPLLVHPNYILRNEVIELTSLILKKFSPSDVYTYLKEDLVKYLKTTFPIVTYDLFIVSLKVNLSRIAYKHLILNERKDLINLAEYDKEAILIVSKFIENCVNHNSDIYNQKNNFNYNNSIQYMINENFSLTNNNSNKLLLDNSMKLNISKYVDLKYLSKIVKKEFYSFCPLYPLEDMKFIDRTFLGKLISASKILHLLKFPYKNITIYDNYDSEYYNNNYEINYFINQTDYNYSYLKNDYKLKILEKYNYLISNPVFNLFNKEIVSQDNYKLKSLFKVLNIIINEDILIDNKFKLNSRETQINSNYIKDSYSKLVSGINSFRPTGQLLTTIYDSDKAGVDKILNLNSINLESLINNYFCYFNNNSNYYNNLSSTEANNKFLTISSIGGVNLFEIEALNLDCEISVKKLANIKDYNSDKNSEIEYKMACLIDYNSFIVGTNNGRIEMYKLDFSNNSNYKIYSSWESEGEYGNITSLLDGFKLSIENNLIYSTTKGFIKNIDIRGPSESSSTFIGNHRGIISCSEMLPNNSYTILFGTYGGYMFEFDLRLNSIINTWRYSDNNPILSIKKYIPNNNREYDCYLNGAYNNNNLNHNKSNTNNNLSFINKNCKYLLINSTGEDQEIGFWNLKNMNCDLLLKVNPIQGSNIIPLLTEIPSFTHEMSDKYNLLMDDHLNKLISIKNLNIYSINRDFYSYSNNRITKLEAIYDISNNIAQCVCTPLFDENTSYILTAGNDRTIRYWDITKESINYTLNHSNVFPNYSSNKYSYVVNSPNYVESCNFVFSNFGNTNILQSNEHYATNLPKKQSAFSDYQHYNGLSFYLTPENEFDSSEEILRYTTKISDASHKGIITDMSIISASLNNINNSTSTFTNLLLTSSWDGTVKIWK